MTYNDKAHSTNYDDFSDSIECILLQLVKLDDDGTEDIL